MEAVRQHIDERLEKLYDLLDKANGAEHYDAMMANIEDLEFIGGVLGFDDECD